MPTYTSQLDPYWGQKQLGRFQDAMGMLAGAMQQKRQMKHNSMMQDIKFRLGAMDKDPRLAGTDFAAALDKYEKQMPGLGEIRNTYKDRGATLEAGEAALKKRDDYVTKTAGRYGQVREELEQRPDTLTPFGEPIGYDPQTGEEQMGPPSPNFQKQADLEELEAVNNPQLVRAMANRDLSDEEYRNLRAFQAFSGHEVAPQRGIDPKKLTPTQYVQWLTAENPQMGLEQIAAGARYATGVEMSPAKVEEIQLRATVGSEEWWKRYHTQAEDRKVREQDDFVQSQKEWDRRLKETQQVTQENVEFRAQVQADKAGKQWFVQGDMKVDTTKPIDQQLSALNKMATAAMNQQSNRLVEEALNKERPEGWDDQQFRVKKGKMQREGTIPNLKTPPPDSVKNAMKAEIARMEESGEFAAINQARLAKGMPEVPAAEIIYMWLMDYNSMRGQGSDDEILNRIFQGE